MADRQKPWLLVSSLSLRVFSPFEKFTDERGRMTRNETFPFLLFSTRLTRLLSTWKGKVGNKTRVEGLFDEISRRIQRRVVIVVISIFFYD